MSTETYYGTETVAMTWLRGASCGSEELDRKLKDSGWADVAQASTSLASAIDAIPLDWNLEVLNARGNIWVAELWKYDTKGQVERKVTGMHRDQKLAILVAIEIVNIGTHRRGEAL